VGEVGVAEREDRERRAGGVRRTLVAPPAVSNIAARTARRLGKEYWHGVDASTHVKRERADY